KRNVAANRRNCIIRNENANAAINSVVSLEDGTPIPFRRCQEGLFVTIPPAMLDDTPNCVIKVEIK
nr:hypothetical protein [Bacteroidales bacterium]